MICAIRPGHTFYEETLNTLKYADRAKKIKNKPTINESPQDKIIRELQEENQRLKAQMSAGGSGTDPNAAKKIAEAEAEIARNAKMLEEMQKTYEQRLQETKDREEQEERAKAEEMEARQSGRPQLLNLNEDGMLDRKIFIDLSKVTTATVGRRQRSEEPQPTLMLGGIGIQDRHAEFITQGGTTSPKPLTAEAAKYVYINGERLSGTKAVKLNPNDRIIFGTGSCFLFREQDKA